MGNDIDEARTILRSLLGKITLRATPEGLKAELKGNIRGLLTFDEQAPVFLRMVAGGGFSSYRVTRSFWHDTKPRPATSPTTPAPRAEGLGVNEISTQEVAMGEDVGRKPSIIARIKRHMEIWNEGARLGSVFYTRSDRRPRRIRFLTDLGEATEVKMHWYSYMDASQSTPCLSHLGRGRLSDQYLGPRQPAQSAWTVGIEGDRGLVLADCLRKTILHAQG